tara:strand:- start:307 stop:567 length:261 start_codon:yes stop_codon:yes gene_type:complete
MGWSNVVGYGNIKISKPQKEFHIVNSIKPWNRIQRLDDPYTTPVNTKNAWTSNKNNITNNCSTMEMNTCEKRDVELNNVLKAQKLI